MKFAITENCLICGTCWEICPTSAITEHEWYYKITESCSECGSCVKVCPNGAIKKIQTEEEI